MVSQREMCEKASAEAKIYRLAVCVVPPQFFWRAEEDKEWEPHEAGGVVFDEVLGKFVFRAKVNHFCQGALGKKLDLQQIKLERKMWGLERPHRGELEVINATHKNVAFLVVPTSYSDKAITSVALGVEVGGVGGWDVGVEQQVIQGILAAATDCQACFVPPIEAPEGPKAGQICPYNTFTLTEKGGKEARVAVLTVDNYINMWFTLVFPHRMRLAVLPRMFADTARCIGRRKLQPGSFSLIDASGMASQTAPVATIGGAGGASAAESKGDT